MTAKGEHEPIEYNAYPERGPEWRTINPETGMAKCAKCSRQGDDLSLLPCTSGPFGTGEKL
jgi:hypothetical protein